MPCPHCSQRQVDGGLLALLAYLLLGWTPRRRNGYDLARVARETEKML